MVKPFDLSELLARIRAVTRRASGSSQPTLSNGVLTLDPITHEVTVKNEDAVKRAFNCKRVCIA